MPVLSLSKRRGLIRFLANDWALTKQHGKDALKFITNYRFFVQRGFTHKAAVFNARNALN